MVVFAVQRTQAKHIKRPSRRVSLGRCYATDQALIPSCLGSLFVRDQVTVQDQQRRNGTDHLQAVVLFLLQRIAEQVEVVQMVEPTEHTQRALKICELVVVHAQIAQECELGNGGTFQRATSVRKCEPLAALGISMETHRMQLFCA